MSHKSIRKMSKKELTKNDKNMRHLRPVPRVSKGE